MSRPSARARVYKCSHTDRWTVDLYWRDLIVGHQQRRSWHDAVNYAKFWTNA